MDSGSLADVKNASRGVWLVKVPKYLSEKWQSEAGTTEIGRLKVVKTMGPNQKPKSEVVFRLTNGGKRPSPTGQFMPQAAVEVEKPTGSEEKIPEEHGFVISNIANQTLAVLSEEKIATASGEKSKLIVEGRVVQKAECRPPRNDTYMSMKKHKADTLTDSVKKPIQMDRAEVKFKPVAKHINHIQSDKLKKEQGRTARLEKHQVQDLIFQAFEKHQYYNVNDLQRVTNQPYTFLKEILVEICRYNPSPPHKNMWELKPEYRHYKEGEQTKPV